MTINTHQLDCAGGQRSQNNHQLSISNNNHRSFLGYSEPHSNLSPRACVLADPQRKSEPEKKTPCLQLIENDNLQPEDSAAGEVEGIRLAESTIERIHGSHSEAKIPHITPVNQTMLVHREQSPENSESSTISTSSPRNLTVMKALTYDHLTAAPQARMTRTVARITAAMSLFDMVSDVISIISLYQEARVREFVLSLIFMVAPFIAIVALRDPHTSSFFNAISEENGGVPRARTAFYELTRLKFSSSVVNPRTEIDLQRGTSTSLIFRFKLLQTVFEDIPMCILQLHIALSDWMKKGIHLLPWQAVSIVATFISLAYSILLFFEWGVLGPTTFRRSNTSPTVGDIRFKGKTFKNSALYGAGDASYTTIALSMICHLCELVSRLLGIAIVTSSDGLFAFLFFVCSIGLRTALMRTTGLTVVTFTLAYFSDSILVTYGMDLSRLGLLLSSLEQFLFLSCALSFHQPQVRILGGIALMLHVTKALVYIRCVEDHHYHYQGKHFQRVHNLGRYTRIPPSQSTRDINHTHHTRASFVKGVDMDSSDQIVAEPISQVTGEEVELRPTILVTNKTDSTDC